MGPAKLHTALCLLCLLPIAVGLACDDGIVDEGDGDADADTDVDADSDADADTGCQGAPSSTQFSVTVWRTVIAPFNFQNEAWDWDGDVDTWVHEYELWLDIIAYLATEGAYEPGTIGDVADAIDPFTEALFSQYVAPDPFVDARWCADGGPDCDPLGSWADLEQNTFIVPALDAGTYTWDADDLLLLDVYDADLAFHDLVGGLAFDRTTLRLIADCGVSRLILSQTDMDVLGTRINAFEVEITSID